MNEKLELTEEEVNVALANARLQLSQQLDDYIYMDCDVQIDKENRAIASRMSEKQLESSIYSQLFVYLMLKSSLHIL